MARPVEWRRFRFAATIAGFHDIELAVIEPNETIMRTVIQFQAFSPVQDAAIAMGVGFAVSVVVIGGTQGTGQAPGGGPWSNFDNLPEDVVWLQGVPSGLYLFQGNTSPAQEVAVYPPGGLYIDTPVMRTNDLGSDQSIWLQSESEDFATNEHTAYVYSSVLVALAP